MNRGDADGLPAIEPNGNAPNSCNSVRHRAGSGRAAGRARSFPHPKLATLLKERRARLGITKRVISTLCHLTHSQIALYEDHNNVPGVATICKLADGYGIPAELIILATLNTQGLLNLPAPGAKITPRIRTRMRKPE